MSETKVYMITDAKYINGLAVIDKFMDTLTGKVLPVSELLQGENNYFLPMRDYQVLDNDGYSVFCVDKIGVVDANGSLVESL